MKVVVSLLVLAFVLASTSGCSTGRPFRFAPNDDIEVTLRVLDEEGKAVPYVTVWGYLLPRASPLAIGADDLWRVTTRYQSSFEHALLFRNLPVPYLTVHPMGDQSGRFLHTIDYQNMEGSDAKRPDRMSIGFTLMKRGYLPGRIDFAVANESTLSGTVILERDPQRPIESQPYVERFERLRYELSDPSRNENISEGNHQRIDRIRNDLEETALQALDAGDRQVAARIYARMEYLPSILFIRGKPAGFSQSDPSSPQAKAYLAKAHALDPENVQVAAAVLFAEGAERFGGYRPEKASEEQRRDFAEYLGRLHAFMDAHGAEMWPEYREGYALWLRRSSDPDERAQAKPLLDELYRWEPKYPQTKLAY